MPCEVLTLSYPHIKSVKALNVYSIIYIIKIARFNAYISSDIPITIIYIRFLISKRDKFPFSFEGSKEILQVYFNCIPDNDSWNVPIYVIFISFNSSLRNV